MNRSLIAILLCLNLAITAALAGYIVTRKEPASPKVETSAPVVNVDLSALESPVTTLNQNLDQLTSTIQRFNTSLVQYDYLKGEMERLDALDRNIGLRAQAALAQATDKNSDETKAAIAKLKELAGQVQTEQQAKRQTMLQLISGLERQLASLSSPPVAQPAQPSAEPQPTPAASSEPEEEPAGSNDATSPTKP